jgi:GNAT superfamily N-acetyltransferase
VTPRDGTRVWIRPDGRRFVSFRSELAGAAAVAELDGDLHAVVDAGDDEARLLYERLGFAVSRTESEYLIPVALAGSRLYDVEVPSGFTFLRADEVPEARLRELDDRLRQDVPGTDGWRWNAADFREETFDSPSFDPTTYLVAVHGASGESVGLARVWRNPEGPRLGLVAVLPAYRRQGLARALLARVLSALDARGMTSVSAEVDDTNAASISLLTGLGARRTGGSIELNRPSTSPSGS